MMNRKSVLAFFALLSFSFLSGSRSIGGDVPFPFSMKDQRFELVDGETYPVIGTIIYRDSMPYFEIDLNEQTWLATERRKAERFTLIETGDNLAQYEGRKVILNIRVKKDDSQKCFVGDRGIQSFVLISAPRLLDKP